MLGKLCSDFGFTRKVLLGLNLFYIVVALILIGVAGGAKATEVVSSLPIVAGITASGVFLLIVAVIGLVGTVKHHQVGLFFYMIILLGIFIIQFSVACACLAVDEEREFTIAQKGWEQSPDDAVLDVEKLLKCCGFDDARSNRTAEEPLRGVACETIEACGQPAEGGAFTGCGTCKEKITDKINYAFNSAGGVGLFFAFTEIVGAVLAYRYRNQIDTNSVPGDTMFTANM